MFPIPFIPNSYVAKWLGMLAGRKESGRRSRRLRRRARLPLEFLEQRLLLTSMVQTAGVLSIHLDTNNEVLQISSNGAGNYNLTTSGTFSDAGIAPSAFMGFGGGIGVLTTSGTTQIIIDDNGGAISGGHVIFNDSGAHPYAEIFSVNLTNAAAGNIDFNGSSTFSNNLTISTTAGAVTVNAGATLNLNGGASILQTTGTGSVILNGKLAVTSTTFSVNSANTISDSPTTVIQTSANTSSTFKITAGTHDIFLNNGFNNLAGAVTFAQSGTGVVRDTSLRNINPSAALPTVAGLSVRNYTLKFDNAGVPLSGGLTITGNYTITSGGDITETGAINGVRGTFTVLGDGSILLNTAAGNNLSGLVVFNAVKGDSAGVVAYVGSGAVSLGASALGLGPFSVTALNGNITQTGAITEKIGAVGNTFTVAGSGTQVVLSNAGNRFEGPISVLGPVNTVNLANTSMLPSFPNLPTTVTTLTLSYANAPVTLPNLSALLPSLDTVTVTAQGISQQAGTAIKAITSATFNAGNNPISLNGSGNDFNHLQVNNAGPSQVVINDINALDFGVGTSALGNGILTVTAGGPITQSNRITQTANAGMTSFTVAAGSSITLTNGGNLLRGIVALNTTSAASLANNTALTLGTVNVVGNLTLTPSGNALSQDPGTTLTIGGVTTITDAGGAVTLNNNGNTFTGSVGIAAASATLRDSTAFDFAASTVTGSLTVHSGGAITQSSSIAVTTALLDAGTAAVTLNNGANNFTGAVSVISTGTGAVALSDTNAIQLGRLTLGTGILTVSGTNISEAAGTANGITQAAGAGNLVLNSNGSVSLNNANNNWVGAVDLTGATSVNGLNVSNLGSISFVGTPAIAGAVNLTAGGPVNLPNSALNVSSFTSSAKLTTVSQNITTSTGGITFNGAVSLSAGIILNTSAAGSGGAGNITFNGDVNPAGPVTLTLGNADTVLLSSGTWNQGTNGLTINGAGAAFSIGNGSLPATFHMVSGTVSMPGAGNLNVGKFGTFQVGGTSAAETVIVHNNAGNITFASGSTLSVGLGATNDLLTKQAGDTGNIVVQSGSRLTAYSGLAGASTTPVLDAASGILDTSGGFFDMTVDANHAAHVFLMGTDIVVPNYTGSRLMIVQGGTVSANGTMNGIEPDSDKFSIKVAAGATLVTAIDVNSQVDVVVRNATGPVALVISTTKNLGDGFTALGGIAINGTGAAIISAPTSDVNGDILVQGNLASLTLHDLTGKANYQTVIKAGGTNAQITTIIGRRFNDVSIMLPTVLNALTLADYLDPNGIDTVTAERFGAIKTTGIVATNVLGDFSVSRLTNLNTVGNSMPGVGAATIANQLSGQWDVGGTVTSVAAKITNGWSLGLPGGANVRNGNLLASVGVLNLGTVANANVQSIGKVTAVNATSWSGGTLQAASFGALKTIGSASLGDFGDFSNVTLTATGNIGGVALAGLSVAGNSANVTIQLLNGNATAISVARQLSNWTLTVRGSAINLGGVTSLSAGTINTLALDAVTVGALGAIGNAGANLFGDIIGATVTVHSAVGSTAVALGTLKATRNLQNSTLTVENGSVTSILVAKSINNTDMFVTGSAGRIGALSAAEWIFGGSSDNLVAQSIGIMAITGSALTPLNSAKIVGDLSQVNILAFASGVATPAISTLSVAGGLTLASSGFLRADNGIGILKVGRDVASAGGTPLVSVRNSSATSKTVGRINALAVGRWNGVDLVANTLGPVVVSGFATPENPTPAFTQGDFTATNFVVPGSTGIDSLSIAGNLASSSNILAPGGIANLIVQGSAAGRIDVDNPTALAGKITTLQLGQANTLTLRAVSIGTFKTVINNALGANGGINGGKITVSGPGPVAIGAVSIGTSVLGGATFDVPHTITTLAVAEEIKAASEIAAGYATGSQIASFTAGRLSGSVLTANSIKAFNIIGKLVSFAGGGTILAEVNNSVVTLLGNVAGVGLGSTVIKGLVSNSDIHIVGGNATSFAVGGMFSSDLLVGFHPVSIGNITSTAVSTNWLTSSGVSFTLGSFTTTGLFDPTDVTDTATYRDSVVVAQKLGVVKINGLDSVVPAGSATVTFGVAFRAGTGTGPTINVNGATHGPGFSVNAFDYLGLAG